MPIARLLIVLSIVSLSSVLHPAKAEKEFRVSVDIVADSNIEEEVTSYVTRELRSIPDIEVVTKEAEVIIDITAAEVENQANRKTGVVIAWTILIKFDNSFILSLVDEEMKSAVKYMTSNLVHRPGIQLLVGAPEDLKNLCSKIVATVDAQYLEKRRVRLQNIQDIDEMEPDG